MFFWHTFWLRAFEIKKGLAHSGQVSIMRISQPPLAIKSSNIMFLLRCAHVNCMLVLGNSVEADGIHSKVIGSLQKGRRGFLSNLDRKNQQHIEKGKKASFQKPHIIMIDIINICWIDIIVHLDYIIIISKQRREKKKRIKALLTSLC